LVFHHCAASNFRLHQYLCVTPFWSFLLDVRSHGKSRSMSPSWFEAFVQWALYGPGTRRSPAAAIVCRRGLSPLFSSLRSVLRGFWFFLPGASTDPLYGETVVIPPSKGSSLFLSKTGHRMRTFFSCLPDLKRICLEVR